MLPERHWQDVILPMGLSVNCLMVCADQAVQTLALDETDIVKHVGNSSEIGH